MELSKQKKIKYNQEELNMAVMRENYVIIKELLDNDMLDDKEYNIKIVIRKTQTKKNSEMYKFLMDSIISSKEVNYVN